MANKPEKNSPLMGESTEVESVPVPEDLNDKPSSIDFRRVVKLLSVDDLPNLYNELGMERHDIERAERNASSPTDVDIKGMAVLASWRSANGRDATRRAILDALERCRYIEAKEILEDYLWKGIRVERTSDKEFYDVLKSASIANFPILYQKLGLHVSDVERAEAREQSDDAFWKAQSVIRWWRKTNGKTATLDILREAVRSSSGKDKTDIPDFDLESVQRQLVEEYLETRDKLHLLPGMPEEFAKMDDLFVDLEIIEEDKKPCTIKQKKLESYGHLVCIQRNGEKGNTKEKKLVKRILVRGGPGSGKSSTVSKLAYDWACGTQDSPISRFQLVLAITINEIVSETDLIGIIQDQLLPKVPRQGLESYMQSNASSVAILLDGYDEATVYFRQCRDLTNVLRSRELSEACVIVSTRQNKVGAFCQTYGSCLQVEVRGFSVNNQEKYINKFMRFQDDCPTSTSLGREARNQTKDNAANDQSSALLSQLRKSLPLKQLSMIPIILSMLCLLWVSDSTLPSTVTALYKDVIMHLAKHKWVKKSKDDDDLDIQRIEIWVENVLHNVGQKALEGLLEDRLVFKADEFEKQLLDHACTLGLVIKERKRSKRLAVVNNVTFLHKTFQELCAAFYLTKLVHKERHEFDRYMVQITHENIFEMEYLLRFACGLSVHATEIIMPYVVDTMCKHDKFQAKGDVKHITVNLCQQMPILLLYEAETNNEKELRHQALQSLLKPLYTVVNYSAIPRETEFTEIFEFYVTSKEKLGGKTYSWLDDVEELLLRDSNVPVQRLLRAMSKIKALTLYFIGLFENIDLLLDVELSFLSELHCYRVKCETNIFLQFLSSLPRLAKLTLEDVSLEGQSTHRAIYPPLRDLCITDKRPFSQKSRVVCNAILSGLSQAADVIDITTETSSFQISTQRFGRKVSTDTSIRKMLTEGSYDHVLTEESSKTMAIGQSSGHMPTVASSAQMLTEDSSVQTSRVPDLTFLPVEYIKIHSICLRHDDACNLGKAVKYMVHLRQLDLHDNSMKPSDCDKLFRGFNDVSRDMQNHESTSAHELEELVLSESNIGDAIESFAKAYDNMPYLRVLRLPNASLNAHHLDTLFDHFIKAGQRYANLPFEVLDFTENEVGSSVTKLSSAYRHMPHLKRLYLGNTQMTPSQCAELFDGFLAAGKSAQHRLQSSPSDAPGRGGGLALELLNMTMNDIGDSVEVLAEAYKYMPHMRFLHVCATKLNASHCAALFEAFVKAATDVSHAYQRGLTLETLNVAFNEVGESVDVLIDALGCMPNLKILHLDECQLREESRPMIQKTLCNINDCFKETSTLRYKIE